MEREPACWGCQNRPRGAERGTEQASHTNSAFYNFPSKPSALRQDLTISVLTVLLWLEAGMG
jgi:hypothetical protein